MPAASCIFCSLAQGDIPRALIAENNYAAAFFDRAPQAPTHILVVPKKHISSLNALSLSDDQAVLAGMMLLVQELALSHGNSADNGFRLQVNTEKSAGQEVFHLHWHFLAQGRQ